MRSGFCRATGGRLVIATATAIAVIFAAAPAVQGAPTAARGKAAKGSISASDLPLLVSDRLAPTRPSMPGVAGGGRSAWDLKASRSRDAKPVAVAELEARREAKERVFRNDDGSVTVDQYTTPIHYENDAGAWVPIDNTPRPLPGRPGWVATTGNDWSVAFGPLSQGVELTTEAGVISMAPAHQDERSEAGSLTPEVFPSPPQQMGPMTAKDKLAKSAIPAPSTVTYRAAQPGVDLRYTVRATGIKEEIVVAESTAPTTYLFDIKGAELVLQRDGSIHLSGPLGELFSIPAPTIQAADGSDLTAGSGVHYVVGLPNGSQSGTQLAVTVDDDWLKKQEPQAFPLVIDPSFNYGQPTSRKSYSDVGGTYNGSGIQIGRDSSGRVWRAAAHFNGYECCLGGDYRVYATDLFMYPVGGVTGMQPVNVFDQGAEPSNYGQMGGTPIGETYRGYDPWITNVFLDFDVNPTVDEWVQQSQADQWFGFRGAETGNSLRQYDVQLKLHVYEPPDPSVVTNVEANGILSTTTPLLHAQPVAAADDGAQPFYEFQVTTGPEPGSGLVFSGTAVGGSDPSWRVPPGSLQEGVTYYAWVLTNWTIMSGSTPKVGTGPSTEPTEGRRFTVDLGLGEGGPSPTDAIGSVPGSASSPAEGAPSPSLPASKLNVNMVNGNLSLSMGTKALGTLTGGLSPGFVYNSLAPDLQGLHAEFFNDVNSNGEIDGGDQLVAQRTDPTVDFFWGTSAAVAGQDPTRALARWTGILNLPSGQGDWELGASSSDGLRITSGSTVLLDQWSTHEPNAPVFGDPFSATGNQPIKIEWRNVGGQANAQVRVRKEDAQDWGSPLSPDMLSRASHSLPSGWTLNGDAASAQWVALEDHGLSVSVMAADGSAHEFTAAGNGAYASPITAPNELLSLGDAGRFVLQSASGQAYTFRPDGELESLVTAADDLNPAALDYGYFGTPLRLRTIHDRVSDRTVNLYYGGDTECGTVPALASGMLCQIAYWDNTVSTLTYNSDGELARFTHPGNIVYDLAYNSDGLLKSVRDPLAADVVAAALRTDDATVRTEINYDSEDRVDTVTQPAPSVNADRPQRTYTYGTGQTEVDVAGFNPPEPPTGTGFAERVRYDSRNRITERTDAAGLTTTYTWDAKDRQIATTDPADLRQTTHYDHHGRLTAAYGPAPALSFDANGLPLSGATVPLVTTEYDGGIVGLAATYWTNPDLAGAPSLHGTGLGAAGDMNRDWDTTLPVTPGGGGWSARFSGDLNVTTADTYTWQIQTRGSRARVWVDETLVADLAQTEPVTGWVSTTGTGQALTAGTHRIRVDMVDTSGPAGLQVLWKRTGAPTFVTLPGNVLAPAYGLVTSVTDADGKVSRTEYSDATAGIGPEYRLPTATVSDPAGANLRTVTTYESPGSGSFLRRVARTLPAGNTSATTNYGATDEPVGGSSTGSIGLRASTAAGNTVAATLVLSKPAGVSTGDFLVAGVATRGGSDVTVIPPAGWTLIRTDNNSNSLQLSSYRHLAGSSEPSTYTWSLTEGGSPASKAAAGIITAYTGVDPGAPIDGSGGQVDPNSGLSIVAPSITTTVSNDRIVGLFTIANSNGIAPAAGMTERGEANSNVSGEAKIAIESADSTQVTAGATGTKAATGSGSGARTNGQLIAVRPYTSGPCSVPSSTPQGGKPKRVTNPDPDGAGPKEPRVEEFVYDSIGRQVGRRLGTTATINTAAWACTTYDDRGRLLSESWPATTTAPARTVTNLYAMGGNPLVNAVGDTAWGSAGVTATVNLLGRVVSYSDIYGDTTATSYDQAGRVTNVSGPGGNRVQSYTAEGRPGTIQVDGVTMATPSYHLTNGRPSSVAYANGTTTTLGYDSFGRTTTTSAADGSSTITGDQVTYSVGGRVKDQQVYTGSGYVDGNPSGDNYLYDGAGRLSDARLPGTTYAYGYGTSSGCTAPDAGKNTNRSTVTITGTGAASSSSCYDHADRLVSSTDYAPGSVVYDDHGNTTQLGDKTLDFDASDRHVRTEAPSTVTRYWRDPLNRIANRVDLARTTYVASSTAAAATGTGVTVNRPTGTQTGDLVVAGLTIANPGTLATNGWNVAATQAQGAQRTWILWRYATGTDPSSWTLSTNGASTDLSAALVTYRGPTALAPVSVNAATTTTAGTSHPLAQVATTSDANQLVHVVGLAGNTTATVPSGVIARATQAGNVSLLLADRYQSRPGASPAANATTGTAMNSAGLTIAVVPAATDQRLGHAGHSDSPSHLDDSSGALIERYYGLPGGVTITEKAATQPATTFSDDFSGTTGAGWNTSKWTTTTNESPPSGEKRVEIQSNQGTLYINGASARATATMTPVVNSEATFSYRFSDRSASSFLRISTRASGATGANQMPNAYRLEIASNSSTVVLQKFVGSSVTQIGSFAYTANTSTQRVRLRVQDNTIQAKIWPDGTTEPANWSVTATDSAVAAAGVVQIAHSHTSGTRFVYLDDLVVTRDVPQRTWSYSNIHGDVSATADNVGTRTWIGWNGPYGENIAGTMSPANQGSNGTSWGWHGQQQRQTDRDLIHMGARPYAPSLGRFLAVDPIEGGCANDYVYVFGDPIAKSDLNGKGWGFHIPKWTEPFAYFGGLLEKGTNMAGAALCSGANIFNPLSVTPVLLAGSSLLAGTVTSTGAKALGAAANKVVTPLIIYGFVVAPICALVRR